MAKDTEQQPELLKRLEQQADIQHTPCGDGSIVWHCWGDGDPLVLLHGGSGSWNHWVHNIEALVQAGYRVIAPDLPGFGDSEVPPGGRDVDVMPEPMQAGLQQIVGDAPCLFCGFSFGAMLAALMAAQFPSRFRALVMAGAPALNGLPRVPVRLQSWERLLDPDERNAVITQNLCALMFVNPETVDALALQIQEINVPRDRLRLRRLARTDIVVKTLPSVQCPVAGIWGAQDAIYNGQRETIEPGLSQAPAFHSLTNIPDTGHWVQYESPALFNAELIKILPVLAGD